MSYIVEDCDAKLILSHKTMTQHMWKLKLLTSAWPKAPFVTIDFTKKDTQNMHPMPEHRGPTSGTAFLM